MSDSEREAAALRVQDRIKEVMDGTSDVPLCAASTIRHDIDDFFFGGKGTNNKLPVSFKSSQAEWTALCAAANDRKAEYYGTTFSAGPMINTWPTTRCVELSHKSC